MRIDSQEAIDVELDRFDKIFIHPFNDSKGRFAKTKLEKNPSVFFIPNVVFSGFHPDCIHNISVRDKNSFSCSPVSKNAYHSKIVVNSFLRGLDEEECYSLFNPHFFSLMRYDQFYNNSVVVLSDLLKSCGLNAEYLLNKWLDNGCFMHTVNHPKSYVLIDIAIGLIEYSFNVKSRNTQLLYTLVDDYLANDVSFAQIFFNEKYTVEPFQIFLRSKERSDTLGVSRPLDLKEFISESYQIYQDIGINDILVPEQYISSFITALNSKENDVNTFNHPYKNIDSNQLWSRAISRQTIDSVDPAWNMQSFKINKYTKVATAGSCFAQHIARTLQSSGLNYFVSEAAPSSIDIEGAKKKGYGLFSARYGNIYTIKQLINLFDEAFDEFTPLEKSWCDSKGDFIDPYRPNIGEVFKSEQDVINSRKSHLKYVRNMFEQLDVFVLTLGLTETWMNICDGAVFPVAPGVISKNKDNSQYAFKNFTYNEILEDLESFIKKLENVNASAKMILTVSPVPLVATYEHNHVLTSTTYSKSVLRAVAGDVSKRYANVDYFPSYEIITGNYTKGGFFSEGLREVKMNGVDKVMGLFLKHYCEASSIENKNIKNDNSLLSNLDIEISSELKEISDIVCDEELIEKHND